ncbi:MAG TPA: molecular chaperone DnaJ [Candidatus Hydrogenedentes bacterium]|nr:molecular chaperone DnaJ [Candidatus Hydrogenedentota bacterium]
MSTDLYEILGVSKSASQDEIRKAYLKLAHKYHPDKTGGDKEAEKKLKEINAAYDILKNPEKRKQYDQFGSTDGQPFSGFGQGFGGDFGESPFGDLFDMLFGQGGRQGARSANRPQPGHDLEYELSVTLEEVARGCKKTISFSRPETCGACGGSGAAKGSSPETCPQCRGAGEVRMAHGVFSMSQTCPRCRGAGRIITRPCQNCNGSGQVRTKRELSIDIPAGVDSGNRLRIAGEGEAGRMGGARGDLYIRIRVLRHDFFERMGLNLVCEAPITISQAALGATIRVPTINGMADLKIPAGAQTGTQLRLRGHGLPDMRGYRQGDQLVVIQVETPQKLSRRQRELLEEFESLSNNRTYPKCDQFKNKIKATGHA